MALALISNFVILWCLAAREAGKCCLYPDDHVPASIRAFIAKKGGAK